MTVRRQVFRVERIMPVRFTRSPGAVPLGQYASDIDDRGYTGYHGPVVGVCRGDTTRVRVVRELLDNNAPLYVTSEDTSKLTIISPVAGQPLANGQHVDITFRVRNTDGNVKVQVRAQAIDGPIVAELTVHVSQVMVIECATHRTAIYDGTAVGAARSAANTTRRDWPNIRTLMREVNRMWRPAGISFDVDTERDNTNLTNQVARDGLNPTNGILLCPVYGSGTTNENFNRLMNTNRVNDRINIYFVREIQAAHTGPGPAPSYVGFGSSHHRGLVVSDSLRGDLESDAHTMSHELGHILRLAAIGHTDPHDSHSDDDPQWNSTVARRRHDLWSRRRLMYYMVGLQAAERTGAGGRYAFDGTDVGYGAGRSGHMITIKSLNQDPTDNEYTDARNTARTLP